jgi:hypothetical protein
MKKIIFFKSIKTVPDTVLADAAVVSSRWPIHLTPRHRKDLIALTNGKYYGSGELWIHLTPGHRKDLRALTNGKCGRCELWEADTSHSWTQKRFNSAHKWQMRQ